MDVRPIPPMPGWMEGRGGEGPQARMALGSPHFSAGLCLLPVTNSAQSSWHVTTATAWRPCRQLCGLSAALFPVHLLHPQGPQPSLRPHRSSRLASPPFILKVFLSAGAPCPECCSSPAVLIPRCDVCLLRASPRGGTSWRAFGTGLWSLCCIHSVLGPEEAPLVLSICLDVFETSFTKWTGSQSDLQGGRHFSCSGWELGLGIPPTQ